VRLEVPWRELGRVPARRLRLALRALPEAAWDETPLRQRRFRVHAQTRSVLLLWADHSAWPEVTVAAGPRYPELKDALAPVAAAAVERVGGGRLVNAVLARLDPGGQIAPHFDAAPFFAAAHRLHVPLALEEGVRFYVDGQLLPLKLAHLFELDNRRQHAVLNHSPGPRVHLIMDVLPEAGA
jgi:hypothetical protein